MILAIKKNLVNFIAIIVLITIAAAVSVYILSNERLRFPYFQDPQVNINAEFPTGQAVVAGQGQTIRVSGVKVGDIGKVTLKNGRAVIQMKIDPEYKGLIRSDATALLRPKTGLKDMFVELNPGSTGRVLKENETLPISATAPDVNPDEIFSALDADTRDYLKLLIGGAGKGLDGRGGDLRDLFRRFEPTHRDLARVSSAVAVRRENLRRLVHNLNVLNHELSDHGNELATLITSSATTLHSFASEEQQISGAVKELPSTLQTTTEALNKVDAFARVLRPAAKHLRPAARSLDAANKAIIPLAKSATPLLRDEIRPFVRNARPVVRDLKPAANNLNTATPHLTSVFKTFNHFLDMLAYNPGGAESPSNDQRQEGYLFWLAWASHDALNLFSSSDANGVFRPVTLAAPCNTFRAVTTEQPELEFLQGLTPILDQACK